MKQDNVQRTRSLSSAISNAHRDSYTVTAYILVSNFVAMATRAGRRKI